MQLRTLMHTIIQQKHNAKCQVINTVPHTNPQNHPVVVYTHMHMHTRTQHGIKQVPADLLFSRHSPDLCKMWQLSSILVSRMSPVDSSNREAISLQANETKQQTHFRSEVRTKPSLKYVLYQVWTLKYIYCIKSEVYAVSILQCVLYQA